MRTPSPSYCRLDLAPPLADQFIFGVAPIDYSPVLLLMPFGFHIAMDTLPSGNCEDRLQAGLSCIQLSPSCPFRLLHTCFLFPAREALPPRSDTTLLIRAPEGLEPSRSTRCSAPTTTRYVTLGPMPAFPTRGYSRHPFDEVSSPGSEGFSSFHTVLHT